MFMNEQQPPAQLNRDDVGLLYSVQYLLALVMSRKYFTLSKHVQESRNPNEHFGNQPHVIDR